jgi:hypothetical protein
MISSVTSSTSACLKMKNETIWSIGHASDQYVNLNFISKLFK